MMDIEDYILDHIDAEGEYLHRLWRDTQLKLSYGQMASGHLQGRLLKMLVHMIRPRMVLELGMFSGYSALSMAEGLDEGSELHTFEIFDEMEDFARPWIEGSPYGRYIHIHIGDALELVPRMDIEWDMAFIDADKREYPQYLEATLPLLRQGGVILADNTLWDGHVVETPKHNDYQTIAVQKFNDIVANDPRIETVILPLRDGLTMIRKK